MARTRTLHRISKIAQNPPPRASKTANYFFLVAPLRVRRGERILGRWTIGGTIVSR
jgi:hypothetical protein